MKICQGCGKENGDEGVFCKHCFVKMTTGSKPEVVKVREEAGKAPKLFASIAKLFSRKP